MEQATIGKTCEQAYALPRFSFGALPHIEWVDYRCRAEFIRPTAIIAIGDKEVTRGRHPLLADIAAARLLVGKLKHRWSNEFDPTALIQ